MPTPSEPLYPLKEKICSRKDCHLAGIPQPASNFYRNNQIKSGLSSWCKNCDLNHSRKWRRENPEKSQAMERRKRFTERYNNYSKAYRIKNREDLSRRSREWRYQKNLGVSAKWYEQKLAEQGGVCAICKSPTPEKRKRSFAVDHDHSCCESNRACLKCVRGLLCFRCNAKLGHLEDFSWLSAALRYLSAHGKTFALD